MLNLENGKLYLVRTDAGEYCIGEINIDTNTLENALMVVPTPSEDGKTMRYNFFPLFTFFNDYELSTIENIKSKAQGFKLLTELETLNISYYKFRLQRFGVKTNEVKLQG
jgi:hypothetical protein